MRFTPALGLFLNSVGGAFTRAHAMTFAEAGRLENTENYATYMGFKLGTTESAGPAEGQFMVPWGIVTDDEYIYVVDHNHRLQKFNKTDGSFVIAFGTMGSGDNQFQNPCGMTRLGNTLYIADFFNKRIVKMGTKGTWEGTIRLGNTNPCDLAFDPNGPYIYVADWYGQRAQKFDLNGTHITSFTKGCNSESDNCRSFGVVADKVDGSIYVSYLYSSPPRVVKYSSKDGTLVSSWANGGILTGSSDLQFVRPQGIAIDDHAHLFVVDWGNDIVSVFDTSTGEYVGQFGKSDTNVNGGFLEPLYVTVDGNTTYIADWARHDVQGFTINSVDMAVPSSASSSQPVTSPPPAEDFAKFTGFKLGSTEDAGSAEGQFDFPSGIVTDDDFMYILEFKNHRLQKFNKDDGSFVATFGTKGNGDNQFQSPFGLDRHEDTLFIADVFNHRVVKMQTDGTWEATIGSRGTGEGQFVKPFDVAIDPNGPYLYVAEGGNGRVQKLQLDGAYVASFTQGCNLSSDTCNVEAVSVDKNNGFVFASYPYSSPPRVVKYNMDGTLADTFANNGILVGSSTLLPFSFPLGLEIDDRGHLLVVDWGNKIVFVFDASTGESLSQFGAPGSSQDGGFLQPVCIATDGGEFFVSDWERHDIQVFNPSDSMGTLLPTNKPSIVPSLPINMPSTVATPAPPTPAPSCAFSSQQSISMVFGYSIAVAAAAFF